MAVSNSVEPFDDIIEYSSWASDIDLVAAGPDFSPAPKQMARWIKVTGAGTLVVVTAKGSAPRSLSVVDGEQLCGKFRTIKSTTSGVTKIKVGW